MEFYSELRDVPLNLSALKEEAQQKIVCEFGFSAVDFSLLNDDPLWFLKTLELEDKEAQGQYIEQVS